ncbi:predicted protein [Paecilomyces variotii No. 5]|uniref:Uncharacterized protein n=1 Tax=Byssochlamys spectabilis (strain No. 5 / NBRC 109023) TaxID=1356009 RepID=V5G9G3_BYSSN|nr:predicted protein [Paecilomyces variotii No. 5]
MSITSHFPNRSEQPTQLTRLLLAKFSYTTTSTLHNAPLNWNHIIGQNDIEAIFERYHGSGSGGSQGHGKTVLKVSQHARVLEELNLTLLTQEAITQNQSMQLGNGKSTVALIVKSPCLAVRYPRSMGQIRRFQLKFSSDRDYYTALAILSELNCPFTESSAGPSLQTNLRPASASSQIRPASASVAGSGFSSLSGNNRQPPVYNTAFDTRASTGNNQNQINIPQSSISSSSSYTVSTGFDATTGDQASFRNGGNHNLQPLPQRSPYFNQGTLHGEVGTRPLTAPVSGFHDVQALNQILPPKRELPFARPLAKKVSTAQDPPKPASSGRAEENGNGSSRANSTATTRSLQPAAGILPDKEDLTRPLSNASNTTRSMPIEKAPQLNSEASIPKQTIAVVLTSCSTADTRFSPSSSDPWRPLISRFICISSQASTSAFVSRRNMDMSTARR